MGHVQSPTVFQPDAHSPLEALVSICLMTIFDFIDMLNYSL